MIRDIKNCYWHKEIEINSNFFLQFLWSPQYYLFVHIVDKNEYRKNISHPTVIQKYTAPTQDNGQEG